MCLTQSEAQNREGIGSGSGADREQIGSRSGADREQIPSQSHVISLSQSEAQKVRVDDFWEGILLEGNPLPIPFLEYPLPKVM